MKLFELHSPDELKTLEAELDALMRSVGLDVAFSTHFVERVLGRERKVTIDEIKASFVKLKTKYKNRLLAAKRKPDYEAVLKDFSNDLNIVFGIRGNQLVNVTIKRKNPEEFHINKEGGEELKV